MFLVANSKKPVQPIGAARILVQLMKQDSQDYPPGLEKVTVLLMELDLQPPGGQLKLIYGKAGVGKYTTKIVAWMEGRI